MFNKLSLSPLDTDLSSKFNRLKDFIFQILTFFLLNKWIKFHAENQRNNLQSVLINHWKTWIFTVIIFFLLLLLFIILWFVIVLECMIFFTFNLNRANNLLLTIKKRVWYILCRKNWKSGIWKSLESWLGWNDIWFWI